MNNQHKKYNTLLTPHFMIVAISAFILGTYSIMLMITVLMYANSLGFSPIASALLSSIFAFAALITRPITGIVTDKFSKKLVFLAGTITCIVAPLVLLGPFSIGIKITARIISGTGMAMASTAISAIAAEMIPKHRFTEGIGYYGIGMTLSSVLAPVFGLNLIEYFGYSGMFLASSIMMIIAFILIVPFQLSGSSGEIIIIKCFKDILRNTYDKKAVYASVSSFFLTTTHISITHLLPYYLLARKTQDISLFFTFSAVSSLLPRLFAGRLEGCFSDEILLTLGYGVLIIDFILLSIMRTYRLTLLIIIGTIYGVGYGVSGMVLNSMAIIKANAEKVGAANATYLFFADLSFSIAPIAWNIYCRKNDYERIYLISAMIIVFLLLYQLVCKKFVLIHLSKTNKN